MQKRLHLACGLLHRPGPLTPDEPTLGLVVQSRHPHVGSHPSLCDEGMTVLPATNYMDEADRLCDHLTIIDHGREVVGGTPAEPKMALGAPSLDEVFPPAHRARAAGGAGVMVWEER
ncbi:hypothetical protein [Nonomuraea basaltis]|uniref:hypothetical protein n=1 Tax=Nonomuraea basaltis TaxID=2495887 RepID=UPI00110C4EB4|nr:hypothetical protein [Nonomuraea basaltis]TMR94696.1 hypothetical protein EJK15_32740 [Nonomuraea basaltis]